jgi:hypothetical protein
VQDEGDECKEQKQVNQQTGGLEDYEAANPQRKQNEREYEKHC